MTCFINFRFDCGDGFRGRQIINRECIDTVFLVLPECRQIAVHFRDGHIGQEVKRVEKRETYRTAKEARRRFADLKVMLEA